jgi:acetyltransferase
MMATAAYPIGACAPQRYPAHLVASRRLADGTAIVIRPIQPEDDAIERAFIRGLSSDTRYNRLLGARKLTPEEIRRLTRIDYAQEMAFVAVTGQGAPLRLLGDARYVRDADAAAEFAVVVADAWQRNGIGTVLLDALLRQAHGAGIVRLHGITLATNQAMQQLARKLGFAQTPDPRDATVRQVEKFLAHAASPAARHASARHPGIAANDATGAYASRSGRL